MQFLIGGVDKVSLYVARTLQIQDEVNARTTASFELVDKTGSYHPSNGAVVEIYDNDANLIFGGLIDDVRETNPMGTSALFYSISCVDFQSITDRRVVNESYTSQTSGAIVKDVVSNTLEDEGIWYNPYALSFDGVGNKYVTIAYSASSFDIKDAITIEAWYRRDSVYTIASDIFVASRAPSWHFYDSYNTGTFRGEVFIDGIRKAVVTPIIPSNEWHHIAFTYDSATHILVFYVDGVLVATSTLTGLSNYKIDSSISGMALGSGGTNKAHTMDDIRIWKNVARTQTEIQANMNKELIGNEAGLVGYWKFNEGSGSTAIDSTANGNDGTITGATYTTDVPISGQIDTGATIELGVYPTIPISQVFDELAEASGYSWWIDKNKALYFVNRSTFSAPFDITTASAYRNVTYRKSKEQYRNKQYIRAGKEKTSTQTATFKGDGEIQTFTVAFKIAEVPTITLNAGAQTVGIRGLDTGKDWYWSKDEKEISQDALGTKLTSSDTLSVSYVGFFPILTVAESASAITSRKDTEGGTGIYESVEEQPSINDSTTALTLAQGKLDRYARISGELTYQTETTGLYAGQIQNITLPIHDIDSDFLIDKVTISQYDDTGLLRYDVHAVDGQALGGWVNMFKALLKVGKVVSIRENEVLIKLKSASDTVTVAESLSYVAAAPESRVGFAVVGYCEVYQLIWNDLDAQGLTWNELDAQLFTWNDLEAWKP